MAMATPGIYADSVPLMKQLAKAANIELAPIRRMVLVLDCDDAPRLFVESFLQGTATDNLLSELEKTELVVSNEPMIIDTTTMQNKNWRTSVPKPPMEPEAPIFVDATTISRDQ